MTHQAVFSCFLLVLAGCTSAQKAGPGSALATTDNAVPAVEKVKAKAYPVKPQFVVECRFQQQPFSVSFQSKSGDMKNNDMSVSILFDSVEVPVSVSPAWYRAVDSMGAQSVCDGIPAYQVEDSQQFLLVLNVEKEKGDSETSLVLIDLAKKKVLNKLENIGKLKRTSEAPRYTVIPAMNGFQTRLIREGKSEDWKWIIVQKGTLTAKWMRSNKNPKGF